MSQTTQTKSFAKVPTSNLSYCQIPTFPTAFDTKQYNGIVAKRFPKVHGYSESNMGQAASSELARFDSLGVSDIMNTKKIKVFRCLLNLNVPLAKSIGNITPITLAVLKSCKTPKKTFPRCSYGILMKGHTNMDHDPLE